MNPNFTERAERASVIVQIPLGEFINSGSNEEVCVALSLTRLTDVPLLPPFVFV